MMSTQTGLPTNLAELQLDPVAERFFRQAPADNQEDNQADALEPPRAAPLSPTERRAMRATFAMLAAAGLALASFLVYSRVIMPQPVQLTGEHVPAAPESAPLAQRQ